MTVEGYTDSDWAGCKTTGKSTSGGVEMIGEHFIKGWSKTQSCVTLSSGEAELVAMCKLSAELLGIISLVKDLGRTLRGTVLADSTAALAIADRKGSGKLRHINIGLLWIQEKENKEELKYEKVPGQENPADMMTKDVSPMLLARHGGKCSLKRREGRANEGLEGQGKTG